MAEIRARSEATSSGDHGRYTGKPPSAGWNAGEAITASVAARASGTRGCAAAHRVRLPEMTATPSSSAANVPRNPAHRCRMEAKVMPPPPLRSGAGLTPDRAHDERLPRCAPDRS
ncbi:hypothetical protein AB0K00_12935 [Dactylosporangium sp. NPDC049525]|uniref:hypothetical protein n=1 Tax=Dactylosporangium sp. NPDC049525 TaxID=3154730 RepID=UPI00343B516B